MSVKQRRTHALSKREREGEGERLGVYSSGSIELNRHSYIYKERNGWRGGRCVCVCVCVVNQKETESIRAEERRVME